MGSSFGSVLASYMTLGKSLYPLRTWFPFQSGGGGGEAVVMASLMSDLLSYGESCIASFSLGRSPLPGLGHRLLLLF